MRAHLRIGLLVTLVGGIAHAGPRYVPELYDFRHELPQARPRTPFAAWEGKAHFFTVAQPHPVHILYFHAEGQPAFGGPDGAQNAAVKHLATSLKAAGVAHPVHSLPWESNPDVVDAWITSQPGPFILSGHGRGGAFAAGLARRHPEKVRATLLLDASSPPAVVPNSLVLSDALDGDAARRIKAFLADRTR